MKYCRKLYIPILLLVYVEKVTIILGKFDCLSNFGVFCCWRGGVATSGLRRSKDPEVNMFSNSWLC